MPGPVFVRVLQMSLTGCYSIGIVLAEGQFPDTDFTGQLVDFSFDETEGKIRIRAELEFWDRDAPAVAGYNGCAIAADVVWTGEEFILRNTECVELEK